MGVQHEGGFSGMDAAKDLRPPLLAGLSIDLKQWRILHAVVSCGSYANAANLLGMSQPAISYTIARMESLLGVVLLRQEGRKAQLTENGKVLLERAGALLRNAFDLEEYVLNMRRGLGPEVRLAVDRDFPTRSLLTRLKNLAVQGRPRIELIELGGPSVLDLLHGHRVDLAVLNHIPAGHSGQPIARVEYVWAAHPGHPLARLNRAIVQTDLDRHTQVVVVPGAGHGNGLRDGPASEWRVSNFETAETALLEGVGFGCLPRHRIEGLLASGRLVQLRPECIPACHASFYIVMSDATSFDPQLDALIQALANLN